MFLASISWWALIETSLYPETLEYIYNSSYISSAWRNCMRKGVSLVDCLKLHNTSVIQSLHSGIGDTRNPLVSACLDTYRSLSLFSHVMISLSCDVDGTEDISTTKALTEWKCTVREWACPTFKQKRTYYWRDPRVKGHYRLADVDQWPFHESKAR